MINILLITLLGGIISLIIGSVWYSDKTPMGRLHMQVLGFDKLTPDEQKKLIEEAKPHMWKSFLGQFIFSSLTVFFIALVSVNGSANGESFNMIAGYSILAWLCFMVPVIGSDIIWGNVDRKIAFKKFFYSIGSYLVTIIVVLLIASLFV
jgi:hypothetical protein